jgi:hypothetical protein
MYSFASDHHDHDPMTPAEMFDAVDMDKNGSPAYR